MSVLRLALMIMCQLFRRQSGVGFRDSQAESKRMEDVWLEKKGDARCSGNAYILGRARPANAAPMLT
jgi:hypothetical protein